MSDERQASDRAVELVVEMRSALLGGESRVARQELLDYIAALEADRALLETAVEYYVAVDFTYFGEASLSHSRAATRCACGCRPSENIGGHVVLPARSDAGGRVSPRAKKPKPRTPKPHPTAFALDNPCPACGSEWGRLVVVIDEDAEELPVHAACARCKFDVSGGAPTQEGE